MEINLSTTAALSTPYSTPHSNTPIIAAQEALKSASFHFSVCTHQSDTAMSLNFNMNLFSEVTTKITLVRERNISLAREIVIIREKSSLERDLDALKSILDSQRDDFNALFTLHARINGDLRSHIDKAPSSTARSHLEELLSKNATLFAEIETEHKELIKLEKEYKLLLFSLLQLKKQEKETSSAHLKKTATARDLFSLPTKIFTKRLFQIVADMEKSSDFLKKETETLLSKLEQSKL